MTIFFFYSITNQEIKKRISSRKTLKLYTGREASNGRPSTQTAACGAERQLISDVR